MVVKVTKTCTMLNSHDFPRQTNTPPYTRLIVDDNLQILQVTKQDLCLHEVAPPERHSAGCDPNTATLCS